jgi:hypothetical protein
MLRIKHPRRRSNDLQRAQDRSSSIDRFTPWVTVMPYWYYQRRRTRLLGPLFSLHLRGTVDLLRRLLASRGQVNRLHGHDGLLLVIFLQRLLLLLLLRLLLLLIGGSQGADSTLRSAPLSLPCLFLSFLENIANVLFAAFTADEIARTLPLALSADCLRFGSCAGRAPAPQLRARDAWTPCQSERSRLFCRWHGC